MKKRVESSHLSLRFYESDGWSEGEVRALLTRGGIFRSMCGYWGQEVGSAFDRERLLAAADPLVDYHRRELRGAEALEYIDQMNWRTVNDPR